MDRADATTSVRFLVPADSVSKQNIFLAASGEGPSQSLVLFSVKALDREGGEAVGQARFERPQE